MRPSDPLKTSAVAAFALLLVAVVLFALAIPYWVSDTTCHFENLPEGTTAHRHPSVWPLGATCSYTSWDGTAASYVDGPGTAIQWTVFGLVVTATGLLALGTAVSFQRWRKGAAQAA
ncbi:MAG: hypothetical protein ACRDMH_01075 [Solirubrobacterales bacterium]